MYRAIDTSIWDDPKFRSLDRDSRLLFIYLFSNRHSHVSGIYVLSQAIIADDMLMSLKGVANGLSQLEKIGLIRYDHLIRVVWVRNMLKRQGFRPGQKIVMSVACQLASLHKSKLIPEYLKYYSDLNIPYQYPIETPSSVGITISNQNTVISNQNTVISNQNTGDKDTLSPKKAQGKKSKSDASHDQTFLIEELSKINIADFIREFDPQGLDTAKCWDDFYDYVVNGTAKDSKPNQSDWVLFEKAFRNKCKWCIEKGWFLLKETQQKAPSLAERMGVR